MKNTSFNKTYIVFDCVHTDSHNDFNIELLRQLKKIGRIFLLSWNDSYVSLRCETISVVKRKYLSISKCGPFWARFIHGINTLLNLFYLRAFARCHSRQYVLIGHEIISLGICCFLFPKGMYLIHHMHIDELQSNIKSLFFSFYKNRFIHIVMTQYIKDYLVHFHRVPAENIKVVPHPLYDRTYSPKLPTTAEKLFVALNYSVDEELVESLISHDMRYSAFADHGCMVIIKSKSFEYSSSGLRVFKGYLNKSEYDQLYKDADCILSMLNKSFKYRISGTMADAISSGKPVIAIRSACSEYYKEIFNDGLILCDNLESLVTEITRFRMNPNSNYYSPSSVIGYKMEYKKRVLESFF